MLYRIALLSHSRRVRQLLGVDDMWNRYERITSVLKHAVEEIRGSPSRNKNCLLSLFFENTTSGKLQIATNQFKFCVFCHLAFSGLYPIRIELPH